MTDSQLKVGQTVELNDGRTAVVRFLGQTSFSTGEWVGVEFEDAVGKNDGSVQGEKYFDCEPSHGMFLRRTGIGKVLEEPTPKAKAPVAAKSSPVKGRPSTIQNGLKRPGAVDPTAAKRQSMNAASPTPGARGAAGANGYQSATKPGLKTSASTATSSAASSRGATPPVTGPKLAASKTGASSRQSLAATTSRSNLASSSSATTTSRKSIATTTGTARTGRSLTTRKSTVPDPSASSTSRSPAKPNGVSKLEKDSSQASLVSQKSVPEETEEVESAAAGESVNETESADKESQDMEGNADSAASAAKRELSPSKTAPKPQARAAPTAKHVEELQSKISVLEKRREEDKDKLRTLDRIQADKDRYEGIIQKLQTKLQSMQQELPDLRTKLKESEARRDEVEKMQSEQDSSLEMAALDREMAEETAEGLRLELDAIKQKAEELELEVEVLREENQELGQDISPEEKTNLNWLQMERANERLREALIRLREITQDEEARLNEEITSMKEELEQFEGLKTQYEETKERLQQSDAAIEDLRQQLDAALGAEDMMEEMTEKNLALNERIEDLKLTIEDLENLKELNDELESNHVETEKQMQEELDFQESLINEQNRQVNQQEEKMADYEYTITKFRELVTNLQSHLDDMKASQQISEAEAEEFSSRSKAMADLNVQLQSSAAKTQMNAVNLELGRLEAQEAAEHLKIVQMFLPEGFRSERESVMAYLRFKRIAFKAKGLHGFLKDRLSSTPSAKTSENTFVTCGIMDKLVWISAMCERFVSSITRCSLEQFAKYENVLHELEPVEKRLDGYIEAFKKDELRETGIADELQRSNAVLAHLAEIHFDDSLETYAANLLMRATLIQNNLESTAFSLSFVTNKLQQNRPISASEDDESTDDPTQTHVAHIQSLIAQARGAKVVAGKVLTALEELNRRSMALTTENDDAFEQAFTSTSDLAVISQTLGTTVLHFLEEDEESASPSAAVQTALSHFRTTAFPDSQDSAPLDAFTSRFRLAASRITTILTLSNDLARAAELDPPTDPPWVLRSRALHSTSLTARSTTEENQRLKDERASHLSQLRARDQTLDEQSVKISLLESRMRDAGAKAAQVVDLTAAMDAARAREADLAATIDAKLREAAALASERDAWRRTAEERKPPSPSASPASSPSSDKPLKPRPRSGIVPTTPAESALLKAEIAGLQGTLRHLSAASSSSPASLLRAQHAAWLVEPLSPRAAPTLQDKGQADLEKRARDVFADLLDLVATRADPLDLRAAPKDRLAWRPARLKSGWLVARRREAWEAWCARRDEVVREGKGVVDLGKR